MPEPLPPDTRPQIRDFRTYGGRTVEFDMKLALALEDINEQVEMLAEIREAAPALFAAPTLPVASRAQNFEKLAGEERDRLGIGILEQLGWNNPAESFRKWRATIEAQGVFVYLLNLGSHSNCRGFCISDGRDIPVIVINNDERNPEPRTYTLLHEYAHILLRESGISDERRTNNTERFPNQFAAFFLMPRTSFVAEANKMRPVNNLWNEHHVSKLAKRFKVSKTVAAIHMEDAGIAPAGFYDALNAEWRKRKFKKSEGGPPMSHEERRAARWGTRHVKIVLSALDRGIINQLDAHELLGVRPQSFGALRQAADEQQAAYGGVG